MRFHYEANPLVSYFRETVPMPLHSGEICFGTVWDVKAYGAMLRVGDESGLISLSQLRSCRYHTISKHVREGDVLLVRVLPSIDFRITFGGTSGTPDPCEIFKKQFGSLEQIGRLTGTENGKRVVIQFPGTQQAVIAKLEEDISDKQVNASLGDDVSVLIKGYDHVRHCLLCRLVKVLKQENLVEDSSSQERICSASKRKLMPGSEKLSAEISPLQDSFAIQRWTEICHSSKTAVCRGHVTAIHLNAIEITVPELCSRKIMLPFGSLPGYRDGCERGLKLPLPVVRLEIIGNPRGNPSIVLKENLFDGITTHCGKTSLRKLKIIFIGATGSGKSSLINTILDSSDTDEEKRAEVSDLVKGTEDISSYRCGSFVLFDTPGVGGSIDSQIAAIRKISTLAKGLDQDERIYIVVFDAISRDYGSTFELLRELKVAAPGRFICCVNRADGMFPMGTFAKYLCGDNLLKSVIAEKIETKVQSVRSRVRSSISLDCQGIATAAKVIGASKFGSARQSSDVKSLIGIMNAI